MTSNDARGLGEIQLNEVAQLLFHQTCEHPRSLIDAFTSCQSFSELMAYGKPDKWTLFCGESRKNKSHVSKMLMRRVFMEQ
jgi:hypothetical protein